MSNRYRAVDVQIWNDDKFPFASDDAQLVWFHVYTSVFSNGIGIFQASVEALAADKNKNGEWDLKRYRKGLGECLGKGFLEYDERFHVMYFPRFFGDPETGKERNRPANPNVLRNILKVWDEIPPSHLKHDFYQRLKRLCKHWGEHYVKVFETLPHTFAPTSPKQNQNQNQDQDQDQNQGQGERETLVAQVRPKTVNTIPTENIDLVFKHWVVVMNHKRARLDEKRQKLIAKQLRAGYSTSDLVSAINGCARTPFNMGENDQGTKYDSLELILRDAEHIDRFIRHETHPPSPRGKADKRLNENIAAAEEAMRRLRDEGAKGLC